MAMTFGGRSAARGTGRLNRLMPITPLMAMIFFSAGPAVSAQGIAVNVNGTPVPFTGAPPMEAAGSVLVPLRGVFEALGASVVYDPVAKTVYARKGATAVTLPLGAMAATVDGRTEPLPQPAQVVGGTTLVPLRFIAQALGASVQWIAIAETVEIKTVVEPVSVGPLTGPLTAVSADSRPQSVTVRADGRDTIVPLSADTILLSSGPGRPATEIGLSEIMPGEQVTVRRSAGGTALSITASYGEVRGMLLSLGRLAGGDTALTLSDGATVALLPSVSVRLDGRPGDVRGLTPGERVVIRTDPGTGLGISVAADTPSRPSQGRARIASFSVDADRPLRVGDRLRAELIGTPGGQAAFAIPGVVENVPLRESVPGRYSGSFVVPSGIGVTGAAVLGGLIVDGAPAPTVQAAQAVTIDTTPPRVTGLSPSDGAITESRQPQIYATTTDGAGTGVDPNSTRIRLDGRSVTGRATVTPDFFDFSPDSALGVGPHTVAVSVTDRAGNAETTTWAFRVAVSGLVQSFTAALPTGRPIGVGETIRFTLIGRPGGRVSVSLAGVASGILLRESAPGVYTGAFTIRPGDTARAVPVSARCDMPGRGTAFAMLSRGLDIDAGPPRPPRILRPQDGAQVGGGLAVEGTSAPGAAVRVRVDYVSRPLGGLLTLHGSAGGEEVRADRDGHWHADGLSLRSDSLFGQDTVFTVSAVAVGPGGDVSRPDSIHVRRG